MQLAAIRSLGGFLESSFEELVHRSHHDASLKECEIEVALRCFKFGNYHPVALADSYFAGAGEGLGPSTRQYDLIDCLVWLLSDASSWLPRDIRAVLLRGLLDWGVWQWHHGENSVSEFEGDEDTGALSKVMYNATEEKPVRLTKKIKRDISRRVGHSKRILSLPETVDELVDRFLKRGIIGSWVKTSIERQRRREAR